MAPRRTIRILGRAGAKVFRGLRAGRRFGDSALAQDERFEVGAPEGFLGAEVVGGSYGKVGAIAGDDVADGGEAGGHFGACGEAEIRVWLGGEQEQQRAAKLLERGGVGGVGRIEVGDYGQQACFALEALLGFGSGDDFRTSVQAYILAQNGWGRQVGRKRN